MSHPSSQSKLSKTNERAAFLLPGGRQTSILAFGPNAAQSRDKMIGRTYYSPATPTDIKCISFYSQTFRFIGCYCNRRGRASVGGTLGRRSPVTGIEPATSNIPSTGGLYTYLRSEFTPSTPITLSGWDVYFC